MIARAVVLSMLIVQSCAQQARPSARDLEKEFVDKLEEENPQCDFEKVHAHEGDPRALLDELLRRSAHGDFLRTEPWLYSVVLCPTYLPAPDYYTVVESYRVVSFTAKDTSAEASVEYRYLGRSVGSRLVESRRTGIVQIEMEKTPFGWRVPNGSVMDVWQNVLLDVATARGLGGR